jgi:hypothetical protein
MAGFYEHGNIPFGSLVLDRTRNWLTCVSVNGAFLDSSHVFCRWLVLHPACFQVLSDESDVMVEWLKLLVRIREVMGSYLRPEDDYPD